MIRLILNAAYIKLVLLNNYKSPIGAMQSCQKTYFLFQYSHPILCNPLCTFSSAHFLSFVYRQYLQNVSVLPKADERWRQSSVMYDRGSLSKDLGYSALHNAKYCKWCIIIAFFSRFIRKWWIFCLFFNSKDRLIYL